MHAQAPVPDPAPRGVLVPRFVCRLATLPVAHLEALRAPGCERILDRLHRIEATLEAERQEVSELLHRMVGVSDPAVRRALLNLRRDLFNLRLPRPADREAANALPGAAKAKVDSFCARLEERGRIADELSAAYRGETSAARDAFRSALARAEFRKGLLLSSRSLSDALGRYLERAVPGHPGVLDKTERGLLRYLARASMKATPFATFCAIIPGEVVPGGADAGGTYTVEGAQEPLSFVRLNKMLFGALATLLLRRPGFRRHVDVELNPTLTAEGDDTLVFLSVRYGRETFQRLSLDPLVELIREMVAARGHLSLGALVRELVEHPDVEAEESEAEGFLDRLVDAGFLRYRLGVPEQEVDWDLPFRALLERSGDEHAAAAAGLLRTLRGLAARYVSAEVEERKGILGEIEGAMAAAAAVLGPLGLPGSALPLHEDVTAPARALLAEDGELRAVVEDLCTLVRFTRRIAGPRDEQATMRAFFDRHYGEAVDEVPLLQFYEDFHREHLKAHLQFQRDFDEGRPIPASYHLPNPLAVDAVDALHRAKGRLSDLVRGRLAADPDAEEVVLTEADLAAAVEAAPELPADVPASVSLFADFIPARDGHPARLVMNKARYALGFGKYFSRFLYLFPEAVTADLLARNTRSSGHRLAEICGDANFNANFHPRLLDWEISYPTGESGGSGRQITAREMRVRRNEADPHALCLRHVESGARVVPLDLGFLARSSRPALFQLLSRLEPPSEYGFWIPSFLGRRRPQGDGGVGGEAGSPPPGPVVRVRPRITFGRVVLARRAWQLPSDEIPRRGPQETPSDFYLRVDRWRRAHRLPAEAYARFQPAPAAGPGGERPRERWLERGFRNLSKPQYVDFASPLLVDLLEKTAREAEGCLAVFEERYPARDDLPTWGGEPHVSELVLQLDFPAAAEDVPSGGGPPGGGAA